MSVKNDSDYLEKMMKMIIEINKNTETLSKVEGNKLKKEELQTKKQEDKEKKELETHLHNYVVAMFDINCIYDTMNDYPFDDEQGEYLKKVTPELYNYLIELHNSVTTRLNELKLKYPEMIKKKNSYFLKHY